jgi:hypothetical protein
MYMSPEGGTCAAVRAVSPFGLNLFSGAYPALTRRANPNSALRGEVCFLI